MTNDQIKKLYSFIETMYEIDPSNLSIKDAIKLAKFYIRMFSFESTLIVEDYKKDLYFIY